MSKITESARGVECQIRIPFVCNGNRETTVWCHANGSAAGKGIGMKSPDPLGAFGCSACHDAYDRRTPLPKGQCREDIELAFHEGHLRSLNILLNRGLVKVA